MKIDNIQLHSIFREKGIFHLHHADTLTTSITFIQHGGLLSRGEVEKNGLFQTSQTSDSYDRIFDVWDDVFLDTADLHAFFKRQNKYGPVMFKFNIDFLLSDELNIWITKNNPIYWHSVKSMQERYYQSIDELRDKWDGIDRQRRMITVRKPGMPILFNALEEIVLDDPRVQVDGVVFSTEMMNAIDTATKGNQMLRDKVKPRVCNSCYCSHNYLKEVPRDELSKLFLPQQHR